MEPGALARAADWGRCYVPEIVAVHEPSPYRPSPREQRRTELRTLVLTAWCAVPHRSRCARPRTWQWRRYATAMPRSALPAAMLRMPAALLQRRPVPGAVECDIRLMIEEWP